MLSCGELCACVILKAFDITQPTLSHDMKILYNAGIVNARYDGKWTYYSLNIDVLKAFYNNLGTIINDKEDYICYK